MFELVKRGWGLKVYIRTRLTRRIYAITNAVNVKYVFSKLLSLSIWRTGCEEAVTLNRTSLMVSETPVADRPLYR